jgi:hypothetical protein
MNTVSNPQNLSRKAVNTEHSFGLRVSVDASDPFSNLVGEGWETFHWFATARERDAALNEMQSRHPYSRNTDAPRLIFQSIER